MTDTGTAAICGFSASSTAVVVITAILVGCLGGCAGAGRSAYDAAERFGPHCEKLGHARGSEAFRRCVENQDINAAAATQREYDRKLLRRLDCVDPRIACDGPSR